jgi:xanthosine utilization system XapX-like protein
MQEEKVRHEVRIAAFGRRRRCAWKTRLADFHGHPAVRDGIIIIRSNMSILLAFIGAVAGFLVGGAIDEALTSARFPLIGLFGFIGMIVGFAAVPAAFGTLWAKLPRTAKIALFTAAAGYAIFLFVRFLVMAFG